MEKQSRRLKEIFWLLYMVGGCSFLFSYIVYVDKYKFEYILILCTYFTMGAFFIKSTFKKNTFIFEPIILVGFFIFMTYSVAPLISIINKDTDLRGHYIMDGAIKSTLIYVVSFFASLLAYNFSIPRLRQYPIKNEINWNDKNDKEIKSEKYLTKRKIQCINVVCIFLWLLGFVFFTRFLLNQGYGFKYILTMGLTGTANRSETVETGIDVFFNMRFFMPTAVLYLSHYSEKKIMVYIMYILTFMEFMAYGFRNILVLLIAAPLVFYYTKNKKLPSLKFIAMVLMGMLIMIGGVELVRSAVRQGLGVHNASWNRFGFNMIWGAVQGNFDLYKTLYGAVTYLPSQHFYTLGETLIFLTIVTCIPRAIWPGKPTSYVRQLSANFIGEQALKEAWALSTLTEYYVEFGIIGCVILSYLLGRFCRYIKRWYNCSNRSVDSIIAYSVTYPMLMLLAVRGYMPINFWQIAFLLIPVLIVILIKKVKLVV